MHIHICIVTGQPLANLIPILQEQPDTIVLLVTDAMTSEARAFTDTLVRSGWDKSRIHSYDEIPDHHFERILERALEIAEALTERFPGARFTFNATGGNKLMAMACTSVFNDPDHHRVIYTDTSHNALETLHPANRDPEAIQSVLDLKTYLQAEGKTLRSCDDDDPDWRARAETRKPATKYLGRHCRALADLVGLFTRTWTSDTGETSARIEPLPMNRPPLGEWAEAIDQLHQCEVVDWNREEQTLYPKSRQAIEYLVGGWLEEYVWWLARDAGAGEAHCSVRFIDNFNKKSDLRNEIDVAVLHHNRLLLIECKTGRNVTREGKDNDILYKLDSLMERAAGALGQGLLVSAQPLVHQTKDRKVDTRARAHSLKIPTAEGDELKTLGKRLQHWIEHGTWPVSTS